MVCQPKSKNMIEHNIEHKKWDKSFYSMWESEGALGQNSLLAAVGTVLWIWIKFLLFPKKAKKGNKWGLNLLHTNCFT